jgi:REP-associated tyrosine transposase
VYQLALCQIRRAADQERFALLAYCFMPDHAHFVIRGLHDDSHFKRFATRAKQFSGYAFSQAHDGQRLWQRYFYEHVLRDEETSQKVIKYVVANPVRGGLVEQPQDYPFLGSDVFSKEQLWEFCDLRGA